MKVVVMGSGVIGLTSAWMLNQAGCDVTVIDRQSRAGEETSFANAGQISYGYSSPWAAPGIPLKAIKWLFEQHAPLKIKPMVSRELFIWMTQMLRNCQLERYRVNKARMLTIATRSQKSLKRLNQTHKLDYQGRQKGTLQLFRHTQQLQAVEKDMALLAEAGTRFELLDANQCLNQEPGLAHMQGELVGGLYLPDDETGDCHLFCQELQRLCEEAGVQFHFNTRIQRLTASHQRVCAIHTDAGDFTADTFVVAMGSYSKALLEPLGLTLPIYPVKGYSLTLPVSDDQYAPSSTIMDETYKVALTRFDDRIRVAGMAELAGFDDKLTAKRLATLNHVVSNLFPRGASFEQAQYWSGFRPMTPDGTPIIGPTPLSNLFTNTGHGTLGWTMACGSAEILTDLVTGDRHQYPQLSMSRYGK